MTVVITKEDNTTLTYADVYQLSLNEGTKDTLSLKQQVGDEISASIKITSDEFASIAITFPAVAEDVEDEQNE